MPRHSAPAIAASSPASTTLPVDDDTVIETVQDRIERLRAELLQAEQEEAGHTDSRPLATRASATRLKKRTNTKGVGKTKRLVRVSSAPIRSVPSMVVHGSGASSSAGKRRLDEEQASARPLKRSVSSVGVKFKENKGKQRQESPDEDDEEEEREEGDEDAGHEGTTEMAARQTTSEGLHGRVLTRLRRIKGSEIAPLLPAAADAVSEGTSGQGQDPKSKPDASKRRGKGAVFVDPNRRRNPNEILVVEPGDGSMWPSCVRCATQGVSCHWIREVLESRMMHLPNKRRNCLACHDSKVKCNFEWEVGTTSGSDQVEFAQVVVDQGLTVSMKNIDHHLGTLVRYTIASAVKREQEHDDIKEMLAELTAAVADFAPDEEV